MMFTFLFGAGFSAPMSYPVGNDVSIAVSGMRRDSYHVHTDEHLLPGLDKTTDDFQSRHWYMLLDIIDYYKKFSSENKHLNIKAKWVEMSKLTFGDIK